ncbi:DUF4129 domain-containing protein [Ketobacter sp.]|uniref:DUF4129 domain-containing protein n=1 Tax=Ketobacter sp. TaxID=2083498 RepID=UPI000F273862|nr:DUF4129 domain-containing protein [Ketobacter sp.]RLU01524.1 MAG: DUF4129 domain-containing protein [Ketobacter sp.]
MDLSKISVQVRPRNPYEAVDLGFVMARQWFMPLLWLWLIPAAPLMVLSYLLFMDQPLWALLLVWWLKPLFESVQLRYISEKLFDDRIRWQDTLRQAHKIALHQWFSKLVIQRLAFSRSFNMPVGELEQLHGRRRGQRLETLHRGAGSSGLWLTAVGNTLEGVLVFGVFSLAWIFIPMEMAIDFDFDMLYSSPLLFPTITVAGFIAMALVSPFYVCGGFMLYINRRTWLEAWDIELTFRQLSNEHQQRGKSLATLVMALLLLVPFTLPQPTKAQVTREESQLIIAEILESDDFHQIKEEQRWRWIEPPEDAAAEEDGMFKDLGKWLADKLEGWTLFDGISDWYSVIVALLEAILWGLVIALFAYLVYRFRGLRGPGLKLKQAAHAPPPSHLFGLELNQDSLPEDIVAAAQALWQQQQFRQAVSLLYRAALTFLIHERHLPLNSSHTEQECLRLCLKHESPPRGQFFQELTRHWIALAYAHRPLSSEDFDRLCAAWPDFDQQEPQP